VIDGVGPLNRISAARLAGGGEKRRRATAQHIRDNDVQRVVDLLNRWLLDGSYGKLTWDRLIERLAQSGRTWTRQPLCVKTEIAEAFKRSKQELRDRGDAEARLKSIGAGTPVDPAVDLLQRKVENLRAEKKQIERLLRDYDERFIRYQYNAQRHGLSINELAMPLPPSPDPSSVAERAKRRAVQ
jgi:hypothetical protein